MLMVYVASPFSEGDRQGNVERQNAMANVLLNEGYLPFSPLIMGDAMEQMQPRMWEEWMEACYGWLSRCDALLRLEGESVGADLEMKEAARLGIPIVFNVAELQALEGQ